MSEQVIKNGNVMERSRTRTIAQVAMLGAVAGVLMNLRYRCHFWHRPFISWISLRFQH